MSYDLVVFNRNVAPQTKSEFLKWYEAQTVWNEEHDYDNPASATPNLREWFMEMRKTFPPMDGKYAPTEKEIENDEDMETYLTEYTIARNIIYASFAWTIAEEAYDTTLQLARKHNVGFFDASSSHCDIILPDGTLIK